MSSKSVVSSLPERVFVGGRTLGEHRIAIVAPNYGLERVSYMIAPDGYRYVRLTRLPIQRLQRRSTFLDQTPILVGPHVDLVHSFNQIVANRPFAVSVEMQLPRYLGQTAAWQRKLGLKLLAARRCRGIWPLSDAAARFTTRRFHQDGFDALANKVEVFRGAVSPVPPGAERSGYATNGPLRLLFVGGTGLRKGLEPTLAAAKRLRAGGVEVLVTVIGMPGTSTYAVPGGQFATDRVEALLAEPWVDHHATMPNAEVRRLMGTHDLFVLPTIDESLGWVVAEAAMSGTPTITTDIFALPEMVQHGCTGWTIALPKDEDDRWAHVGRASARAAWPETQTHITDRIVEILSEIAADRGLVARYGRAAHAHIAALYGMDVAAAHLAKLYAHAIHD